VGFGADVCGSVNRRGGISHRDHRAHRVKNKRHPQGKRGTPGGCEPGGYERSGKRQLCAPKEKVSTRGTIKSANNWEAQSWQEIEKISTEHTESAETNNTNRCTSHDLI
jgi:hypothetical protein